MVLNYYWTYFSSQELSLECACQQAYLWKHSSPFQIFIYVAVSLPLPYICTISIFNYPGYFWRLKRELIHHVQYFTHLSFLFYRYLVSSASFLRVWVIAVDFTLVLPLNSLPSLQTAHSCDLTKCYQFMLLCFVQLPSWYIGPSLSPLCAFPLFSVPLSFWNILYQSSQAIYALFLDF